MLSISIDGAAIKWTANWNVVQQRKERKGMSLGLSIYLEVFFFLFVGLFLHLHCKSRMKFKGKKIGKEITEKRENVVYFNNKWEW